MSDVFRVIPRSEEPLNNRFKSLLDDHGVKRMTSRVCELSRIVDYSEYFQVHPCQFSANVSKLVAEAIIGAIVVTRYDSIG